MKLNELRVGNYIFYNDFITLVSDLHSPSPKSDLRFSDKELVTVFVRGGYITEPLENLNPIPLFRSFFEDNGFIEDDNYGFPVLSNSELHMTVYETGKGWHVHIDDQDYCTSFSGVVENLHTLQNIYFFASGKELEFKLCLI